MSRRDLKTNPAWRAEDLGVPIPDSTHAVSVALPLWEHVIGYEEGAEEIRSKLPLGYPRFVYHPTVGALAKKIAGDVPALPLPSRRTAEVCKAYVERVPEATARIIEQEGLWTVASNEAGREALKLFWQHTGLIITSRQAHGILNGQGVVDGQDAIDELKQQISSHYECDPSDVYLHPTGMASMYDALETLKKRNPDLPTIQTGFPYVDSYKLQEEFGSGVLFILEVGKNLSERVEETLLKNEVAGCFCEVPGNPMLGCPDLNALSSVLRAKNVPLVVDDTIATPFNVDVSPYADLVVTSLTKFMTGTGDVTGGALICNPKSPYYTDLKKSLGAVFEPLLWGGDAQALEPLLRGFTDRMKQHNANGAFIAKKLRNHPAVEKVWYPEWEDREAYDHLRKPEGGYGALMTFLPKNASTRSPEIYDALQLTKGPSLGTVFTLACPFTLLAHYEELDWVESCGVSRYLIRISVGIEDPEVLWKRIQVALDSIV